MSGERYLMSEEMRRHLPLTWSVWLNRHGLADEAVPLPNEVHVSEAPGGPWFSIQLLARDAKGRMLRDRATGTYMRRTHSAPLLSPVPAPVDATDRAR